MITYIIFIYTYFMIGIGNIKHLTTLSFKYIVIYGLYY